MERHAWALCAAATAMARSEGSSTDALEIAGRGADRLDALDATRRCAGRAVFGAILARAARPYAAATEFRHARPGLSTGLAIEDDRVAEVVDAFLVSGAQDGVATWLAAQTGTGREACTLLATLLRDHTC